MEVIVEAIARRVGLISQDGVIERGAAIDGSLCFLRTDGVTCRQVGRCPIQESLGCSTIGRVCDFIEQAHPTGSRSSVGRVLLGVGRRSEILDQN